MRRALIAAAVALAACGQESISGPIGIVPEPAAAPALAPHALPAFFDCLRERSAATISAHRGRISPALPENALESFQNAIIAVPAFLEIDVRHTRDGALVLMHDETVDRTTDGEGAVNDLTLAELQALGLRGMIPAPHPPTLREALDWANGKAILELDLKEGVRFEDVVTEVRSADAMHRVVFITYSIDGASRLAQVAPEAMIYTTITSERDLDVLERRGVDLSHIVAWLGVGQFDEDLVEALAARGVESRFGMFGAADNFDAAVHAGIQSLAVDNVVEAFRQMDRADGAEGYVAMECVSAE